MIYVVITIVDVAEELKVMIWQVMQTHLKYILGAQGASSLIISLVMTRPQLQSVKLPMCVCVCLCARMSCLNPA